MASVLVTGCAGFLGSHLCDALLAGGHGVWGLDNLLGGELANVPVGVKFREGDCTSLEFCRRVLAESGAEVVYHLAAAPHEGLSVFSPWTVTGHTYLSTVALAAAAVRYKARRFVFTSSMARYGHGWVTAKAEVGPAGVAFQPFDETMRPAPVDPYGIAKVAAEQTLAVLGREHGMEVVVAVPHNIIGPRQKYDDPYRNVAAIFVNLMLQGRQPFIYGDGFQRRVFSDVADCVQPLLKMGFQEGLDGEVINVGPDDNPVTVEQLARTVAALLGFNLRPVFLPDRPCEVKDAWPSADKARRLLGYEPKTRLADSLRRMIDFVTARGPKAFKYHLPLEIVTDRTPRTWKERLF